ncbi:MAG: DsbA family protein [Gemmatimonadales bacterium]|nr:DsbA family protein [Gemmatimonadales bacterium]
MNGKIVVVAASILAAFAILWPRHEAESTFAPIMAVESQEDPLASRAKGSPTAPVTVFEMSDFQCPYCRRHALETYPTLEREYVTSGKVRWVFVNFPLPMHPNATPAAEVAMCGAQQGKFWPIHDLLFEHQAVWAPLKEPAEFMLSLADSVGADRAQLTSCVEGKQTRNIVESDAMGAAQAGAQSTPTFYIEGGLLVGAYPIEVFRQILDSVHTAKTSGK